MAIKVAINGFGRIGRLAYRLMYNDPEFEIVGINDLTDAEQLAYLLKYDTAQGNFMPDKISHDAKSNSIIVDGKKIKILSEPDARKLPWKKLKVDVVLECTGFYTKKDKAAYHLEAGAKRVLISAPSNEDVKTIVYGVNHKTLNGKEKIVSGASCTTNGLAPVINVLEKEFGVLGGVMTTVHAYTGNQPMQDGPTGKLYSRRGRAGAQNIVPTSTGAAKAIGKVIPEVDGKLDGGAIRVPTITGSLIDLVVELKKEVTVEMVNKAMKKAADNITLQYQEDPIVSSDVIGTNIGSIFDANSTKVIKKSDGKQLVQVMTWYDNEMGYAAQLIRTFRYMVNKK